MSANLLSFQQESHSSDQMFQLLGVVLHLTLVTNLPQCHGDLSDTLMAMRLVGPRLLELLSDVEIWVFHVS